MAKFKLELNVQSERRHFLAVPVPSGLEEKTLNKEDVSGKGVSGHANR